MSGNEQSFLEALCCRRVTGTVSAFRVLIKVSLERSGHKEDLLGFCCIFVKIKWP